MKVSFRSSILLITTLLFISCLCLPFGIAHRSKSDGIGRVVAKSSSGSGNRTLLAPRRSGSVADKNDQIGPLSLPKRVGQSGASLKEMLNSSTQASQGTEARTYETETVWPAEFNGDVRNLPPVPSNPRVELELKGPPITRLAPAGEQVEAQAPNIPLAPMPNPLQNFAGMSKNDECTGGPCGGGWPPDTTGDVGLNHYIQAVNTAYAIYNKTGTLLASFTENSLWSGAGTGTPCDSNNRGDPEVVYNQFSDRWYLTHFAFGRDVNGDPTTPFFQCFAVSKTTDPVAGGWWLYAVRMDPDGAGLPPVNTLNDYPKFGNWNDGCLHMTANGFLFPAASFNGVVFASFSKSAMESGAPLNGTNSAIGFLPFPANRVFTVIPSNISGAQSGAFVPPMGTPNYMVSQSQTQFAFEVRKFTTGGGCGAGGTLGAATNVSQAFYSEAGAQIVPQPPPATASNNLDSVPDRLMQNVQYRRVGADESLWVVHSVQTDSTSTVQPQWAQLSVTAGTVATTPVQEQIYAPDTTIHRWMSSIAADHAGNAALGYSTSNETAPNFPSIKYSGRLATDPLNMLPQTEVQLVDGSGSQVNNCGGDPCQRWGDYSALSVDPSDDCTFWYTNEYFSSQANGTSGNWQTQIGSFKFPSCSAPTAAPATISGRVATTDGLALAGVTMRLSGASAVTTISDTNGNYRFDNVDTDNFYTVTPSLVNYNFSPGNRSFSLLGNKTDATFTGTAAAIVTANAIDSIEYFVRQQYVDFLGREPDQGGFDYWTARINECGSNADCIRARRIDVSAAFFVEPEFQQTGSFIYRLYKGALGRRLSYTEFSADQRRVTGQNLDQSKTAFTDAFVQRAEFVARYQADTSAASFVDALLQTVNDDGCVDLSSERGRLITLYNSGNNLNQSRSIVLRDVADNQAFSRTVYNQVFVLMEYFGYLRRDPDQGGYDFWLDVVSNRDVANYRGMVCAFISSAEYQRRFGSLVTRTDSDCGR